MEERKEAILRELEALQAVVSAKAQRQCVEQIERRQEEKIRALSANANLGEAHFLLEANTNSETACMECVEAGDLTTAFGTILRYIDTLAQSKAERKEVEAKATTEYAEQLFQRLSALSKHQIDETTTGLSMALKERLQALEDEFSLLKSDVEAAVEEAESNVAELASEVAQYGIVHEQYTMKRTLQQSSGMYMSQGDEPESRSSITPRRQTLKKSFEMSQRRNLFTYQKPRPKVSDLTSTLHISSKTKE